MPDTTQRPAESGKPYSLTSSTVYTIINYVLPPDQDRADMARRLMPESRIRQQILAGSSIPQKVGQTNKFWVIDEENRQTRIVEASLVDVSDNFYWYFEQESEESKAHLKEVIQIVEEKILPVLNKVLGRLWASGPDGDSRLTILHAHFTGPAGYYASSNQYPRSVQSNSNERAIIYLNQIEQMPFGSVEYLSTLTHELQHAIHWASDPTEEAWINEGLSEVIKTILAYPLPFLTSFELSRGAISLTSWPADSTPLQPYYGSSTRFFQYLISHYGGPEILGELIALEQDGTSGIDALLQKRGYAERFDDVFENWIIANALDLPDGPYSYPNTEITRFRADSNLSNFITLKNHIPQYAAHYISFTSDSPSILRFEGSTETSILPTKLITPFCWWSNRGDSIDTTLTRSFDLTNVSNASLQLTLWYEIEKGWDYAYVEVAEENESKWDIIRSRHSSETNTAGNAFGPGYSGSSGGWITDEFDLSDYSGKQILLRIEYATDDALNGSGLCLAAASIPAIDYSYIATEPGVWNSEGFVFINNKVDQNYSVQVILFTDPIQVVKLDLDDTNKGMITLPRVQSAYDKGIVVVAPMTPLTTETAPYAITLEQTD